MKLKGLILTMMAMTTLALMTGCSSTPAEETTTPAAAETSAEEVSAESVTETEPETVPETEAPAEEEAVSGWTMGFAAVEIPVPENSEEPLYIAGYNQGWKIKDILDLPRASAVWMEAGDTKAILIGVDCIALSSKNVADIRTDLAAFCEETGCSVINIYATHNHASLDTFGMWGPIGMDGKNSEYMLSLTEACRDAARQAYENRKTGRLFYGKADADILRDSREPIVYDSNIHQFRFDADEGDGIRLVSYVAHAESLRSDNRKLSRDFPGVICDLLKAETGDDFIYMPSTVGGLLMTKELVRVNGVLDAEGNMKETGRILTDALLSITDEEEIAPTLKTANTSITVPLDNTVFEYYRFLGILDTPAVDGDGATGYAVISELGIICLGDITFALIPGEIFPELVTGEFFSADRCASPQYENPTPLKEIAASHGHDRLFILGLANDELGYIVPPNDFLINPEKPYFENYEDAYGENHYEETNSTGLNTAHVIAAALDEILAGMAE